jgi:transposase-like protein
MSALNQPHFQDSEKAREYLESVRWPNGPICAHCGVVGGHYQLEGKAHRPGLWKCKDCREQFTVTVGTVFERSKIALNVWLQAVYLLCSSKKGMSSHQLHRTLGVTYKTAWFMTHRIREAMTTYQGGLLGGGGGIVEADETYWGNLKGAPIQRGGYRHKMKVVSLVERGGKVRSFHVRDANVKTLKAVLKSQVSPKATLFTDGAPMYKGIAKRLVKKHDTVEHTANEYARGIVHTNTIESFFSIMKRGLIGTYHHVGVNHLQRYVREFDFRYNHRAAEGFTDDERTRIALKSISGKRLTYKTTNRPQRANSSSVFS